MGRMAGLGGERRRRKGEGGRIRKERTGKKGVIEGIKWIEKVERMEE